MQSYLQKQAYCDKLISADPPRNLAAIVVIPAFNEAELSKSIDSVLNCEPVNGVVEIIPILNLPQSSAPDIVDFHEQQYALISKLAEAHRFNSIRIHAVPPVVLPDKLAGVGLARKIGMDEAVRRFEFLYKNGIIINFDADCTCHRNYLSELIAYMDQQMLYQAVSIGFEHRWDSLGDLQKEAIQLYELHLRAYIGWQKYYGYPYAFQTLGSCFAVRSKAYQEQGGMNRRKAGEDFYFLHKYSIHGTLGELNMPLVYPSGRISHRVPFGTGKAVYDILHTATPYKTYNPEAIRSFIQYMSEVRNSYDQFRQGLSFHAIESSESMKLYLDQNEFKDALGLALQNSSGEFSFANRISKWFEPFRLMKYLHFARERGFPDVDVHDSAQHLLRSHGVNKLDLSRATETLLGQIRQASF